MAHPEFHELDLPTFLEVLRDFPFRRRIDGIHLHHTWRPRHADYRGLATIVAMWRHHTQVNGWSDIAQHLSIAPDGTLWTGRDWNRSPASAAGFNGNSRVGPFMIEMIGDFDQGRDRLEGPQLDNALAVVAAIQRHFGLAPDSLRFHNAMSAKTCPGSAVDRDALLARLAELHRQPDPPREAPREGPFAGLSRARQVIAALDQGEPARADPADAELQEAGDAWSDDLERGGDGGPSAAQLEELAPHLINLNQGRFSQGGLIRTGPGDVDRIFDEELPRAMVQGRPLRLLFYAHGGLVSEAEGLDVARKQIAWWRANEVYPLHFVWETGFWETLGQLLLGGGRALPEARGFSDFTDFLIEQAVGLPGGKLWAGMKFAAEAAVEPPPAPDRPADGGGAHYVARKLKAFCDQHGERVELHAVGHSAGSIFHGWFLPTALELGVPAFKSLQLLAPAITVEDFKRRLLPLLGRNKGVRQLTLFTMRKALELDDHVAWVYRKSLLYLIYYALERRRETPILGLEEALREDAELRRSFGLDGRASTKAEAVFSTTPADQGRSASRATSHGGFDDDPPTMDSVLRRVLGVSDTAPIESFVGFRTDREIRWQPRPAPWPPWCPPVPPVAPAPPPPVAAPFGARRRALCVGIDRYLAAPLSGCVADARLWAATLARLGFEEPVLLLDEQAGRAGILQALERLVAEARPGDVLVFQYSGHGTQVDDLDGDEDDAKDEALCPYDYETGAFVIDDDLAAVFGRLGEGVNLTVFLDCCHSGTGTRLGAGGAPGPADPGARRRYLPATPAMNAAHARFRRQRGLERGARRGGVRHGPEGMREVTFSACQPWEVAWESQGQGDFTRHAVRLLEAGTQGLSNAAFQQRLEQAFGPAGRQRPLLDCAPAARELGLLAAPGAAAPERGPAGGEPVAVARLLEALAALLSR